jgi:steroid delta-isomerase-like uncharacterized protein
MSNDPKDLIPRIYSEMSAGNLDALDELLADDLVEHEETPGLEPTKEGVKQFFAMFLAAFPDLSMKADQLISEGDIVCARATMTGTHNGEFMGIPATGKPVEVKMIDIVRVRDGQAVEHWGLTDSMALMQQLGAIPEEAPA